MQLAASLGFVESNWGDLLGRWTDSKATTKKSNKSTSAPEENGDSVDKPLPRRAMPAALRA